ncbi:MAG TPA: hypothetical protein VHB98_07970, partial [Chloroflexota bacterium]|nr:hypothetical protein [Chloroflexota bacterium]
RGFHQPVIRDYSLQSRLLNAIAALFIAEYPGGGRFRLTATSVYLPGPKCDLIQWRITDIADWVA